MSLSAFAAYLSLSAFAANSGAAYVGLFLGKYCNLKWLTRDARVLVQLEAWGGQSESQTGRKENDEETQNLSTDTPEFVLQVFT
jgi:hypothetical protein